MLQFLSILQFFVHHVFRIAIHFHQFHSGQIRCHESSQLPLPEHIFIPFRFRKMSYSSLDMHFHAHEKLEFRKMIHVDNSMNGRRRVTPGQRKHLSSMDGSNHRRERERENKTKPQTQNKGKETKKDEKGNENRDTETREDGGK
jgi:hypothetical protein